MISVRPAYVDVFAWRHCLLLDIPFLPITFSFSLFFSFFQELISTISRCFVLDFEELVIGGERGFGEQHHALLGVLK